MGRSLILSEELSCLETFDGDPGVSQVELAKAVGTHMEGSEAP